MLITCKYAHDQICVFRLKFVHVSSLELIFCHQEIQKVEEVHRKHFAWETCWQFIRGVAIQLGYVCRVPLSI